jgi:hypothetical protein
VFSGVSGVRSLFVRGVRSVIVLLIVLIVC